MTTTQPAQSITPTTAALPAVATPDSAGRWADRVRQRGNGLLLCCLLLAAATVHLWHLGHEFMAPWDEVVHAVVARNLVDDPTTPTLYRYGALPAPDLWSWDLVMVWLHVPSGGMLAAAASMKILGATPFAMRLPGVVFTLIGMIATYSLGRRLFGSVEGLVGAFILGFAPLAVAIGQGYSFGDMTDTPVIGLTPVVIAAAVKGWQTGQRRWLLLAGIVVWLLYLSKSALGLAPVGVVVALFVVDLIFPTENGWRRPGLAGLTAFLAAVIGPIGLTNLYLTRRFPIEMAHESGSWKEALFTNYEGWGGPVDLHLTFDLYVVYGAALSLLILVAVFTSGYYGLVRRRRADLVVIAWFVAVYLPLTIAVAKSPPLTVAAIGASGLAVGRLIGVLHRARTANMRALGYGLVASTAVLCVPLLAEIDFGVESLQYELTPRRPMMSVVHGVIPSDRAVPYVILGFMALVIAGLGRLVYRLGIVDKLQQCATRMYGRNIPLWTIVVAVTAATPALYMLLVSVRYVGFTDIPPGPPPVVGRYLAEHTPENATIFVDKAGFGDGHGALMMMFWSHRDAYQIAPAEPSEVCPLVPKTTAVGSTPVLITVKEYAGPGAIIGKIDGWLVYQLAPCR